MAHMIGFSPTGHLLDLAQADLLDGDDLTGLHAQRRGLSAPCWPQGVPQSTVHGLPFILVSCSLRTDVHGDTWLWMALKTVPNVPLPSCSPFVY